VPLADGADPPVNYLATMPIGSPGDRSFRSDIAQILVRQSGPGQPWWLVTWLPDDQSHPSYPGFTVSSDTVPFPTTEPLAAAEWVDRWVKETVAGRPPSQARVLDVPVEEFREVRRTVADAGWESFFWAEPDGRFSWTVEKDGIVLRSGTSDAWDDAKLETVVDFPPPRRD
jgi:hypothetical protein